jgi:hypothetical protein
MAQVYRSIGFRPMQVLSASNGCWHPQTFVCLSKLVETLRQDSNSELSVEDEESAIWTVASLYGAAADTTVINLTAFTLAMVKFPESRRKTQEEIGHVFGTDRLPSFPDRENLPYVAAMVTEAIRWWPISPISFPDIATEEFEYKELPIPKGRVHAACGMVVFAQSIGGSRAQIVRSRMLAPTQERARCWCRGIWIWSKKTSRSLLRGFQPLHEHRAAISCIQHQQNRR